MNPDSSRLQRLHNRHRGERAILVANGPSLNRMDLAFLKHETVIGLNKIYLGFRKFGFYPRYYVAVNRKVIEQAHVEIKRLNCVKFLGTVGAEGIAQSGPMTYLVNTHSAPDRFCRDLSQGMHEGWTVTFAALQVAYYLGFREVVLIGLDHRYEYSGSPNESRVLDGPDANHFCPEYFGYGQQWDNPDLVHSEESYLLARKVFSEDGRRILDATVDGACKIFDKVDYRNYFSATA
jgi:hypothetical protein